LSFWPAINYPAWKRSDTMPENQQITKDTVVLYHADCNDGFGAAFAAWKKFGDSADYIPIEHQSPLPEGLDGKQIFFIDIIPPDEAIIKKVIKDNASVVAIDHHKTSESKMNLFKDYSFDNGHSASILAWKYFHPDKPVPKLLLFIEDVDIWKWEYPETDKFISALSLYEYDFNVWDKIASDIENPDSFAGYLSNGEIVSNYSCKIVGWLSEKATMVEFEGYKVYAVNAPHFINGRVAHDLIKESFPFAIAWFQEKNVIHASLRSDGTVDVSEIAKKYGGGGHKTAAGFSFPAEQPFPWGIIKND